MEGHFITTNVIYFAEAEHICQSKGANLISIQSAEENKFPMGLANRDRPMRRVVWIGAKKIL
jgi:hypothetical protein